MADLSTSRAAVVAELMRRETPPPLEHLFGRVKEFGLRVNNLFHRMDGQWQCNLRSREAHDFFNFGWGPTAADAVLKALQKAVAGDVAARPAVKDDDLATHTVGRVDAADLPAPSEPESDDDDLVG